MAEGMEKRLQELQCPFTWDMSKYETESKNLDSISDEFKSFHHDELYLPQLPVSKYIIASYAHCLKEEHELAEEKLREAEKRIPRLNDLKKDVAQHILEATKAYLFYKKKNFDEVENILKNIKNIEDNKNLSVLNEFKALTWKHCTIYTYTVETSIKFSKLSLEYDEENASSHYLMGKNLRSLRRLICCFSQPGEEEMNHLLKAHELEPENPQFAMYVGQCFKENREKNKAYGIISKLNTMDIQCPNIRLRLALYFIQNQRLNDAEKCLTYVKSVQPESSMFKHYMGLFLMKKEKFKEAAEFLKKTYDEYNIGADLAYAKCMRSIGKRFDYVAYFLDLLNKYKQKEEFTEKEMLLHIAFTFFNIKRDIRESIKYFFKAFQIETKKFNLLEYHDPLTDKTINVYKFLTEKVFPKMRDYIKNKTIDLPEDVLSDYQKLQEMCEVHSQ